jgi:hypothetical protein
MKKRTPLKEVALIRSTGVVVDRVTRAEYIVCISPTPILIRIDPRPRPRRGWLARLIGR